MKKVKLIKLNLNMAIKNMA